MFLLLLFYCFYLITHSISSIEYLEIEFDVLRSNFDTNSMFGIESVIK